MLKVTDVVYEQFGGRCEYCGEPVSRSGAVFHHVINRCLNGASSVDNLVPRHPNCENDAHYFFRWGNVQDGEINSDYYQSMKRRKNTRKRKHHAKIRATNRYQRNRRYA